MSITGFTDCTMRSPARENPLISRFWNGRSPLSKTRMPALLAFVWSPVSFMFRTEIVRPEVSGLSNVQSLTWHRSSVLFGPSPTRSRGPVHVIVDVILYVPAGNRISRAPMFIAA